MIRQCIIFGLIGFQLPFSNSFAASSYQKVRNLQGELVSIGSDTLKIIMHEWANNFKLLYPEIKFSVIAKGSATAPVPLAEGVSDFAPMSRKMNLEELELFEQTKGYKPTPIKVAIDALGVFVKKNNPVNGLTIEQVDGIFSKTYKCGGAQINDWSQVSSQSGAFNLYSRNNLSGTYGFFQKVALCKGAFRNTNIELDSSVEVLQKVAFDPMGIGYSGLGFKIPDVKALPIAKKAGQEYINANAQNASSGKYPLSRYLYIYIDKQPKAPLSKVRAEFVKYILSKEGQKVVSKYGYISVPDKIVQKEIKYAS